MPGEQGKTVAHGLILRETETKETDKILTVLTAEMGKIPVIARGARRKNSRLAAACQLFAWSETVESPFGPFRVFPCIGYEINQAALLRKAKQQTSTQILVVIWHVLVYHNFIVSKFTSCNVRVDYR